MIRKAFILCGMLALFAACVSAPPVQTAGQEEKASQIVTYKRPAEFNLRFKAYTVNMKDPSMDRRCYYRVFVDKVEIGRTSTGLESQFTVFDAAVSVNRHLLEVEKWVLNPRENQYVKLNKIDQPRPNFVYFEAPRDRIVIITLVTDNDAGRAMFGVEHERD